LLATLQWTFGSHCVCLCVSESGGGTYCAVAALHLMGFVQVDLASNLRESTSIDIHMLLDWCLQRQVTDGGFQGRINKPSDTCYAFWVGGVLKIIGAYHLIDHYALREFLLTCQSPVMTNTSSLFCQLSYILKLVMLFSYFFLT